MVEQQKQSQLSIKQFCADCGLSYQTFYYWSKRLSSPDSTQTLQPIIFNEHEQTKVESVIITFANGIRAELPTTLNTTQIKHWVDALQ
ncbi:IS66 family insertion sequence element accessory protein TnpA [Grimontia marina]|uniref:IS66 family insertion sequence element accessory protein TnpA n=1 Tax=Grimontia marina TaxID=646534 RepID=UPI003BB668D2